MGPIFTVMSDEGKSLGCGFSIPTMMVAERRWTRPKNAAAYRKECARWLIVPVSVACRCDLIPAAAAPPQVEVAGRTEFEILTISALDFDFIGIKPSAYREQECGCDDDKGGRISDAGINRSSDRTR
jgi:hypothetical protein